MVQGDKKAKFKVTQFWKLKDPFKGAGCVGFSQGSYLLALGHTFCLCVGKWWLYEGLTNNSIKFIISLKPLSSLTQPYSQILANRA